MLFLENAAEVVKDSAMLNLVKSPGIDKQTLAKTIFSISNEASGAPESEDRMNFISLPSQNSRLEALPEIKKQFQQMKQELERVVEATITTASEISEESLNTIKAALETKLNQSVSIEVMTDEGLIGGAKIQMGDSMIDASVRSQIDELGRILKN
jgi:ATP synthase, F1 delta subunit